jgi:hypothetical protein
MTGPVFIRDAYTTQPTTPREMLVEELRRVKLQLLSDASDPDVRARIAELERELAMLDARRRP